MTVNVTIRHVPEEVRDELAARASRSGRSLQEYLLGELTRIAGRPTPEDLVARLRERKAATGTVVRAEDIVGWRNADRR